MFKVVVLIGYYYDPQSLRVLARLNRSLARPLTQWLAHAQCYLKDTAARLEADVARAAREGWAFGAKTVRGAYLVVERARAQAHGYESPVHATAADTHANYDRWVRRAHAWLHMWY